MNLKYLFYSIASLIFVIALSSCNGDSEYTIDGEQSPEGRIISFAVETNPYPVLKTTKFTIQNRGEYHIFNIDSLPLNTGIRTLKVNLKYASEIHLRTDLVYPKDSTDYPSEWNETDSVKFFKVEETGKYWPQFEVIAPNGYKRTYQIDFNIHQQDPDAIVWQDAGFALEIQGETKVILSADKSQFIAFTNNKSKIYCHTSPVALPVWTEVIQAGETLPAATTLVKSLLATDKLYVMVTSDGLSYTSPIEGGLNWTKHDKFNIQSIVGLLPELPATKSTPLNEFLITYFDNTNTLIYGKTSDFETPLAVKVLNRNDNKVMEGFPIKQFSSIQKTTKNVDNIIVSGGIISEDENSNKLFAKKSWVIKNESLGNPAEVYIYPNNTSSVVPFDTQITSFLYDDKIYAISSDSLNLYQSGLGDGWIIGKQQQKLNEEMADMNLPSVVVDKDNYIWVFGGISNETSVYSQQIWRGRINRLAPKD